jgi:hypothetical protein
MGAVCTVRPGMRANRHAGGESAAAAGAAPMQGAQAIRSDLSHSGRHNDNDERQRLFKRSAPSYVEGGPIAEIL